MQRLEVSGAVRPIYGSLGVKRLIIVKLKSRYSPYVVARLFKQQLCYFYYEKCTKSHYSRMQGPTNFVK